MKSKLINNKLKPERNRSETRAKMIFTNYLYKFSKSRYTTVNNSQPRKYTLTRVVSRTQKGATLVGFETSRLRILGVVPFCILHLQIKGGETNWTTKYYSNLNTHSFSRSLFIKTKLFWKNLSVSAKRILSRILPRSTTLLTELLSKQTAVKRQKRYFQEVPRKGMSFMSLLPIFSKAENEKIYSILP